MSLDQLANIGELVGGFAVLVSLVYVGFQLRQNTKVNRALARQSLAERAGNFQFKIAESPQLAHIIEKRRRGEPLSDEEGVQLRALTGALYRSVEEAFLQYREGYLEEEYWVTRFAVMKVWLLASEDSKRHWSAISSNYHREFVSWVNQQIAETDA